jgi:hypothetical protein
MIYQTPYNVTARSVDRDNEIRKNILYMNLKCMENTRYGARWRRLNVGRSVYISLMDQSFSVMTCIQAVVQKDIIGGSNLKFV